MFDIVLKMQLLLSVISVPMIGGEPLNLWDMKLFHCSIIFLFLTAMADNPCPISFKKVEGLVYLLFVGMLSVFFASFKTESVMQLLNYLMISLGIVLIVRFCSTIEQIKKWIIAGAVINLVVLLFQKIGFNPILTTSPMNEMGGIIGNAPRYSTYICIVLPLIFEWSIPVFCMFVISTLIGDPQCAILGIAFMIVIIKVRNKYFKVILAAIPCILAIVFWPHIQTSLLVRIDIYKQILQAYFQHPLLGYGLGASLAGNDIHFDSAMWSSYFSFIYATGIAGIIFLYYILRAYLLKITKSAVSLCILSIVLLSFIEYPLEIPRLSMTIIFLISAFIIETKERVKSNEFEEFSS